MPGMNGARVLTRTGPCSLLISAMRTNSSPGPVSGPKRGAHKRDGTTCAIEERLAGLIAGRDELGRCKVGGEPFEAKRDLLVALNADNAVIPVWQPLRGNCRKRGENKTHQRGRNQGFDQREACHRGAIKLCAFSFAVAPLQADRIDFHCSPAGCLDGHNHGLRHPLRARLRADVLGRERQYVDAPGVVSDLP